MNDDLPLRFAQSIPWILLALAHSGLGERFVLKPLFRQSDWRLGRMPRSKADPLLRFAWHATSFAWLGLAALPWEIAPAIVLTLVALVSGLAGVVFLRWHIAWPLFLFAAGAAGRAQGWLQPALPTLVVVAMALLALLSALHVYWALGGRTGLADAVPTQDGEPLFRPGALMTLAVAVALATFAGLLYLAAFREAVPARALVGVGAAVLTLRAAGDGRYVGFSKTRRDSRFAALDDVLYTPIAVFLVFGALGALAA
ncbi:MAG: DUF3995 domain-containing protein [Acidobacteriota bacterium]